MEDKVRETKYLRAIAKQILMVEHLPRRKRESRYSGTMAPAYAKASAFVPINIITLADKTAGRKAKAETKTKAKAKVESEAPAYAKALAGRKAKVEAKAPAYAKALAGRKAEVKRYNAIKPKLLMRIKS